MIHRGDKKAPSRGSGVPVEDMVSCFSIREAPGVKGGVELSTVYFEDPRVLSPHMINVTLKAKLWEIIQKQEAAFRQYCGKYPNGPPEVARPLAASGVRVGVLASLRSHRIQRIRHSRSRRTHRSCR